MIAILLSVFGCTSYKIRESSLVPSAIPAGPPSFRGRGDVYVGDSTLTFLRSPVLAENENAALWIPRAQLDGTVSVRFHEKASLRFGVRYGFPDGAIGLGNTQLKEPREGFIGGSIGVQGRLLAEDKGDPFELKFVVDIGGLSIPTYLHIIETEEFGETREWDEVQHPFIFTLSAFLYGEHSLATSASIFWAAGLQNQPTNVGEYTSSSPENEVSEGPLYPVIGFGADLHPTPGFSVVPQIYWPVYWDPILYGPVVSLGLRATFGTE